MKGTWTGTPTLDYTYEWLRAAAPIPAATSDIYEVHGEDEGHTLTCEVTATNAAGFAKAASSGMPVPNETKTREEEELAAKKKQEEEAKAREAQEKKEKEDKVITSVDNTRGDLAPYSGVFNVAYQPFAAESTMITYAGVTIGNPELPTGPSSYKVTLKICTVPECEEAGSELGSVSADVNNYGLSTAEFAKGASKKPVSVTPGETYYLVWTPPPAVNGVQWLAYWHAGRPYIVGSQEMEAIVRGYDGGAGEEAREDISYRGTESPPAPHVGPFNFADQDFTAASNRIKTIGVVVGNPKLPPGLVNGERIKVRLCESPECNIGHIWEPAKEPVIVNYGVTEATIDATVTLHETYFVNWTQPALVEGEPWDTFWYGQSPELKKATATQAFARGIDEPPLTYTPTYYKEKPEPKHGGIATFSDYENASGIGPEIEESKTVEVTCKVFAPEIASVEPEGYWYRIHSTPWNDEDYAAANAFANGGSGANPIDTDPNVPDC